MDKLLHIKAYIAQEEKAINEANKTILFTIPEIVDRDDEIVTAQAMLDAIKDKKTFAANPICMPCHQHRLDSGKPPCVGNWDVASATVSANVVNITLNFAADTELGGEYWKCYSKRHMRAVSIGFNSLESHIEDRSGNQIRVITKIELFEISCVAVGANQGALSKLKSVGTWQDDEIPEEIKSQIIKIVSEQYETRIVELETQINDLETLLIPDSDGLAESLLGKSSESPVPAEKIKAENPLQKLLKIIQNSQE